MYRKIAIPCRPQKTFSLLVQEVPNELPEDDIRASLYRYASVVRRVLINKQTSHDPFTGGGDSYRP